MKRINNIGLLSLFLCFVYDYAPSQTPGLIFQKSVVIPEPIAVSLDRNGFYYFADSYSEVHKFDNNGKKISTFSSDKPGLVTIVEAWQSLRILLFYADFQEYIFLDRFLNSSPSYRIEQQDIGFISLLTLSEDNQLWLFDNENIDLIKYDYTTNQVTLRSSLNNYALSDNNQIDFMKAYQQQLFLNDHLNGILQFDNYGNYLKTLPYPGLIHFNFYKDEIYFIHENRIVLINLYNLAKREITLPDKQNYKFVFIEAEKVILIYEDSMVFYRLVL